MSMGVDKFNEQLCELLIEKMQTIDGDWESPWLNERLTHPLNVNGRFYSGVNKLILSWVAEKNGWHFPVFTTFKMAKDNDIQILKGSHGCPVVFFKSAYVDEKGRFLSAKEVRDMTEEERSECPIGSIRVSYTNVFNVEQTNMREVRPDLWEDLSEQYKMKLREIKDNGLKEVDALVSNQGWVCPIYTDQRARGFYTHESNEIRVTPREACVSDERYYGVLFHEMAHSTGHHTLLGRHFGTSKRDPAYAREELVAELSSALTAAQYGLSKTLLEGNAVYLKGWLSALRKEPDFLTTVLQDATKASNMICEHIVSPKYSVKNECMTDSMARIDKRWDKEGHLDLETYYDERNQKRRELIYYSTGQLAYETTWDAEGRRDGLIKHFNEQGQLIAGFLYRSGILTEGRMWSDSGRLIYEAEYGDNESLKSSRGYSETSGNLLSKWREYNGHYLVEEWNETGSRIRRDVLVRENGPLLFKEQVKGFRLNKEQTMSLRYYQPIKLKGGWLQLDMDGQARYFKSDPTHIYDEVQKLAQELEPALRDNLDRLGADPDKYIRIKAEPNIKEGSLSKGDFQSLFQERQRVNGLKL